MARILSQITHLPAARRQRLWPPETGRQGLGDDADHGYHGKSLMAQNESRMTRKEITVDTE